LIDQWETKGSLRLTWIAVNKEIIVVNLREDVTLNKESQTEVNTKEKTVKLPFSV